MTTSAMASEIGESADVVARIVRNRPATRDIAQRIGIGSQRATFDLLYCAPSTECNKFTCPQVYSWHFCIVVIIST